ncbi:TetR/AcrR family transcriptional regulator [Hymenobacter sp. GOD-10R]|uniref:TetR/AcrR family transcriptional regulator n=1 Tax=Hymenobacter sp. GOD-10R TaxID=3093922 RepID=UPI002D78BDD7|nr:TetR/AcrR family transcriptional regulator [Hymenobacter sp. GOD-10R]WRQ26148.1 TetR/AcrR family transcriptional regulator [Hymenobacter sp. GOD-10R]
MPAPGSNAPSAARQRILKAAHQLFYAQGIRATGIDQLLAVADVARMSFYKHFPSKQALVVAFLHERHSHWQRGLEAQAKARAHTPADEVRAIFGVLADWFGEADFRGCAFINTVLETTDPHTEEYLIARQHKQELHAYLEELLRAAKYANPSRGATQLLLLIDGAIVRAQLGDGPAAALTAQGLAELLLAR